MTINRTYESRICLDGERREPTSHAGFVLLELNTPSGGKRLLRGLDLSWRLNLVIHSYANTVFFTNTAI